MKHRTVTFGNGAKLRVEVAETPVEQAVGLSFRRYLAPNTGMAFFFEDVGEHAFTVARTRVHLDFVFVRHGRVVDLVEAVAPGGDRVTGPGDLVLEVGAGWARAHGVSVGMAVTVASR